MAKIVFPFLLLASIGFAVVFAIHVATLFGNTFLFEHLLGFLGPGIFVVWLPTGIIGIRMTRDFKQKDFWRAALRGCPEWMRKAQWVLLGYAWVGFFALPFLYGGGTELLANKARSMSAVVLILYSLASTVLFSATRIEKFDLSRRCLNGHPLPPLAKFCEECGAPVQTINPASSSLS